MRRLGEPERQASQSPTQDQVRFPYASTCWQTYGPKHSSPATTATDQQAAKGRPHAPDARKCMRWCTCRQRGPRTGHLQQPLRRSCERHQGLRSVRFSTRSSERLNDMLVLPY